ncbi:F-box protein At5g07670-like [Nicotiana tomentosiformis]|uniref:F-box protein At5g07670-like n=1 Tax=Nicotiana tomentosiformis TaxID=4098 RepID=UPI00051C9FE6|nr:F-box protein At5g07670-like [Nicotiana tomentosiformis]
MSYSPEKPNFRSPLKGPPSPSWTDLWLKNKKALNHVLFTMHLQSRSSSSPSPHQLRKSLDFTLPSLVSDPTSLLSDETLLYILSKLPNSQRNSNSLVSKRWLYLQGRLVRSIKLLDWDFLVSGRVFIRFPNLIHVDLVNGSLISPGNSGIFCSHELLCSHVDSNSDPKDWFFKERFVLPSDEIDRGLRILASGCPNLRRLLVVNASELGLLSVAEECPTLQVLELHRCNDHVLRGIAACQNLQILRLIGNVDGFYKSSVTDIGLTILAQGCKRLVKLELSGCEGSYEGIKAIAQCCQMLEELILHDHRMEGGWLFALSYCESLKTLRFLSCKSIDQCGWFDEDVGSCLTLERLHLEKCQLRNKESLRTLFLLCQDVREVIFQHCWGLDNEMFSLARVLRRVKSLCLESCSLLTTEGLESALLSWKEIQSLKVISCGNIMDSEISPSLSTLFSALKDLQWRPDTKTLLSAGLVGTCMRKRGSKVFKKTCDWKSLPGA